MDVYNLLLFPAKYDFSNDFRSPNTIYIDPNLVLLSANLHILKPRDLEA